MVTLPKEFTATKFPGYFWNVNEQKLYSIKIAGKLREIKMVYPNRFNAYPGPGYRISHKGYRKFISITYLQSLSLEDSEIEVQKND